MLLSAIVFVLAVGSECLAAQSDRSRHDSRRSGPIRSVPVAADVKRDVDFDCPEEFGYYPHPTDCTLYYVCVFGGALLESCTGGLMYSHELQTCDWPRNVGCDATGAVAAVVTDDVERISERVRDPPPPPRRNPLPPPRVQPNPIVTSRGQPKFNRDEYEKQQQLYAEVDDLPPVEEIESDRQQRVYRGQPSTIGQVQKDRDGYISQVANPGRNVNSNIIPASISQNNGKIGSFSFGTQVEERRIATATQAPQTYRPETSDNATDSLLDVQLDILTNEVHINDVIDKPRHKREIVDDSKANNDTGEMSKRIDGDEEMEYFEIDTEPTDESDEESFQEDSERGKRQIRYYLNNGHKNAGKNWGNSKPVKFIDIQQFNYNPNNQNIRHQSSLNGLHKNNLYDASSKPYAAVNNISPTANTYSSYQNDNTQSQRPFKPSMPDPFNQKLPHNPMNAATQIITKSPPISSLKNNENPFSALAGGFYNNLPKQNANSNRFPPQSVGKNTQNIIRDSYLLPSTVVTGKPVSTVAPIYKKHKSLSQQTNNPRDEQDNYKRPSKQETYDYENASNESGEDESSEENSSEKDENSGKHDFKFDFPDPPYEFTHPSNKYADIENPFANPNFDFDDFLAKLQNDHYSTRDMTTPKSKTNQNAALIDNRHPVEVARPPSQGSENKNSLNYQGMSTPRPFTTVTHSSISGGPIYSNGPSIKIPEKSQQSNFKIPSGNQQSHRSPNEHQYRETQQNAGTPLDAARPKLKPPNFRDDRILPISYNFDRPINTTQRPNYNQTEHKGETQQVYSITQRPYVFVTGTRAPVFLSTPKLQYLVKPGKIVSERPHLLATGKPYLVSTIKPHVAYLTFKPSTSKPLTTLANEQLAVLQQYWRNPSTELYTQSTPRPTAFSNLPKLENLFSQTFRPSLQSPIQNQNSVKNSLKDTATSTTKPPEKRRPIPKPSPEMNDYYYDDNEQYYEPPVKSIYMPSSEVKPQRPPMAQNYQEYDDSDSYEDDDEEITVNITPHQPTYRQPTKNNPESVTKNHNDVSVVTKAPHKESYKNANGKIPVPVMIDLVSPSPTKLNRPEVSNYEIVHHVPRNRTFHIRKPGYNGPNTVKPPKYLNQTTLRPYTVRHRLAKPTTEKEPTTSDDVKQNRGRIRHHNLVAQTKMTTPRDSHNQETRFSKTKHDDKTNSLEPVDNVTPSSYTASPRPKMLYNGSQNYSPDQYDPFYAVYDEDGELYKDTVQQTYRGTPPPARRPEPVQYTQRPSADDYDDTLIQGQINNDQNQYQVPVRHSTRGEGNELGYEHPSSVKTTIYEATSISTTPSTTSTSTTTTYRPTTAPYTEAMTPSRYSPRSSTDENLNQNPNTSLNQNPSDGFPSSDPFSPTIINLSSLAKPFEKTDNTHRLKENLQTEKPTQRLSSRVTNKNNNIPVEVVRTSSNENKKVVSLTTGFSIRRNSNNTNNPYTLTVLTRPFDNYHKSRKQNIPDHEGKHKRFHIKNNKEDRNNENIEESIDNKPFIDKNKDESSESSLRRSSIEDEDIAIYTHPESSKTNLKEAFKYSTEEVATTPTTTTKYYLKTVIKRPAPFASADDQNESSTENTIDTESLIESGLQNAKKMQHQLTTLISTDLSDWENNKRLENQWNKPAISPYRTLDNLRNNENQKDVIDYTTSTLSSTRYTTTEGSSTYSSTKRPQQLFSPKPAYYSYKVGDDVLPDHTTEIFSGKVKSVIKAFLNNFGGASNNGRGKEISSTVLPEEERVINIGFQKKMLKHNNEVPARHHIQRVHIISEPPTTKFLPSPDDTINFTERGFLSSSTRATTTTTTPSPPIFSYPETTPMLEAATNNALRNIPAREYYESKFSNLVTEHKRKVVRPETENTQKFLKIIEQEVSTEGNEYDNNLYENIENELTKSTEATKTLTETERNRPIPVLNEIASTTSTTKSTTTYRADVTSTTKSLSFPTRASRVNPAIKLAATNPGLGRRSYQSTKCSSDNSLQPNPKCNDIKYQRPSPSPTNTRGRGSAHYSTLNADQPPQQTNRGTPPTRSRPTLKPSTAIVSKTTEFVDIYTRPPSRPNPVYPQPTPDKTAAKCRKDVCLLPDCYCGGKDIPGDLEVETVPQIVLLTFDDSVNDLNKVLYADLFEKGRVNPNGCPISATFYVSHEWTDYSQVQNLYAAGHEMASHTISHSFGEQFSQKKWNREVGGQREILAAYGGVKLEDVRGMRAPFLSVGGNKMFKMLYDSNFTYDSSMPVYENRPPSWPYTLDYKLFHDCMIPPCPTKSYPGVWEVPMVMWQDLNGGRCSMGDACANPPEPEGVYKMLLKNFDRHYTTNRAPFGLFYHAAWFTQPHHKEGFIMFLDFINSMKDVWIVTNWQALQWVRDPTPINRLNNFQPFQCNYQDRPKKCNNPKVCNLWHKSGVRYMRTCQPCPEIYPWTGKTGIRSSRIDNDIDE
ncbi:chitin deacetylase-like 5 isoform X3 [Choristoneura fumiferana]|uniref:chitin deacetylase-like 5 isoform X3 n=1 Tax=Choristoneura fumiferana TaxID=7141 RepID=UPI003D15ED12